MAQQMIINTPLVVFADVGEDADDELAIYLISKFGMNTTIVFMPSSQGSSQDGFDEWKRLMSIWDKLPNMSYITFEEFVKIQKVVCDYVLQISPMPFVGVLGECPVYTGHNLTVNKEYIFGGIYHTKEGETPSFNLKNSKMLLEKFQHKLVEISSELMAAKRPFMDLYNLLPPLFKEKMSWNSFRLTLGRMSENHPVAHIYAEGLINSLVGRGANEASVREMYNSVFEREIEQFIVPAYYKINLDKKVYEKTYELTKQYLDKIQAKHVMTENNLFRMNIALTILFPKIWNTQSELISSDKITPNDPKIKALWERFKTFNIEKVIKTFNPIYDLFAAYILLNVIKSNFSNTKFSIEEDYQNQFNTFIVEYLKKGIRGEALIA